MSPVESRAKLCSKILYLLKDEPIEDCLAILGAAYLGYFANPDDEGIPSYGLADYMPEALFYLSRLALMAHESATRGPMN